MNKKKLDFLSIVFKKSKIKNQHVVKTQMLPPTLLASLNKTNELNVALGST